MLRKIRRLLCQAPFVGTIRLRTILLENKAAKHGAGRECYIDVLIALMIANGIVALIGAFFAYYSSSSYLLVIMARLYLGFHSTAHLLTIAMQVYLLKIFLAKPKIYQYISPAPLKDKEIVAARRFDRFTFTLLILSIVIVWINRVYGK